jgi:hypothetical protein
VRPRRTASRCASGFAWRVADAPYRWLAILFASTLLASSVLGADPPRKPGISLNEYLRSSAGSVGGGGAKAKTTMFGIEAEGYKFVYCMDRSGSMGGSGRKSLPAVKAELLASLKNLDTVHQFQIVFYNEQPVVFNPTGTPGRLAFATDQNKRRAEQFLDTIVADGGTDHEQALRTAIALRPDVIFFLTDADQPELDAEQLKKIAYLAGGITIHAIEFGPGPKPAGESFLAQLASQNGGQYTYVDITQLKPDSVKR